jgi:hypothetical protein
MGGPGGPGEPGTAASQRHGVLADGSRRRQTSSSTSADTGKEQVETLRRGDVEISLNLFHRYL